MVAELQTWSGSARIGTRAQTGWGRLLRRQSKRVGWRCPARTWLVHLYQPHVAANVAGRPLPGEDSPGSSRRHHVRMRVYVTGASGFIGGHLVHELRAAGAEVREEWIDLHDRERLRGAIAGCDAVCHLAALYSYDAPIAEHERVNVEGTRTVVELCRELGVRRFLQTSTAGTCGPVPGEPATEEDAPPPWELSVPYKGTKLEAERIVLAAAREGLDAVVVNPTTPVGGGDRSPTPTGRMIEGIASGRYRAYLATGLNIVDVRDVAHGHVLSLKHGGHGERYILGGADLELAELFAAVAQLAGLPRPRLRLPYATARVLGWAGLANRDEIRLARLPMYFSWAKAARELGYSPGPVGPALAVAVREALARVEQRHAFG
jgi:dihydroflavonol-4-reductase